MKIKLGGKLEDASSREYSMLIPNGAYLVKVCTIEELEKQGGKANTLQVEMELLDGPKDSAPFIGDHISDFVSLHENAIFRVKNLLVAATGNKDIRGAEFDSDLVIGKMLVATFKTQEYNGEQASRVQSYKHASKWGKTAAKVDEPAAPASAGGEMSL